MTLPEGYVRHYPGEILRCEVGSTLHGTGLPGGEDRDEMGVCLEEQTTTIGLGRFEQHVWRSRPEGVRSGPGDIDLTVYSARKFLLLAAKGNPSILLLFFVPPEKQVFCSSLLGRELQALADVVISKRVAQPYLGYMRAQYERLVGIRHGRHTNRPELEDQFGYDTKYAMHMLRLGYQGIELLQTGRVTLPIPHEPGEFLRNVRRGKITLAEVLECYGGLEVGLMGLAERSPLRAEPDYEAINTFLINAHLSYWKNGVG